MIELLLIPYAAITSRLSGMDMPKYIGRLPEIAFALPFGYLAYTHGGIWFGIAALLWSYAWMETGHGVVLQWGANPAAAQGLRRQFLSPVVDFIAKRCGLLIGGRAYCWLFMGIKGLLIGLPVAPAGILLGLLWPLGYEVGFWFKRHVVKEVVAGLGAGIVLYLSTLL